MKWGELECDEMTWKVLSPKAPSGRLTGFLERKLQ
jgi:hypothetical protein